MDLFGKKFAAVLFDMDGTLISSTAAVDRSWSRLAQEYDAPLKRLGDFHGVPSKQLIERLLPDSSESKKASALARIIELETHDVAGIETLPGAETALRELGAANRAAIVTSCSKGLADARLAATKLPVPQVIVTADDVEIGKPNPAPYLLAAQKLGADPRDCLVVEDAPAGCESGRAAGMTVLAVEVTHPTHALAADAKVTDLAQVRFDVQNDGISVVKA